MQSRPPPSLISQSMTKSQPYAQNCHRCKQLQCLPSWCLTGSAEMTKGKKIVFYLLHYVCTTKGLLAKDNLFASTLTLITVRTVHSPPWFYCVFASSQIIFLEHLCCFFHAHFTRRFDRWIGGFARMCPHDLIVLINLNRSFLSVQTHSFFMCMQPAFSGLALCRAVTTAPFHVCLRQDLNPGPHQLRVFPLWDVVIWNVGSMTESITISRTSSRQQERDWHDLDIGH